LVLVVLEERVDLKGLMEATLYFLPLRLPAAGAGVDLAIQIKMETMVVLVVAVAQQVPAHLPEEPAGRAIHLLPLHRREVMEAMEVPLMAEPLAVAEAHPQWVVPEPLLLLMLAEMAATAQHLQFLVHPQLMLAAAVVERLIQLVLAELVVVVRAAFRQVVVELLRALPILEVVAVVDTTPMVQQVAPES
jgi:hypothetical protein